jgi:hypothetical protein
MDSFPIRIDFRGHRFNAQVHQHDSYYLVWFTDSEIVKDFGGQVTVHNDFEHFVHKETEEAKDKKDFHAAIVKELLKA